MKRLLTLFAPVLLAAALGAGDAHGWEAATTHAGLTEQSALSSELHKRLQEQLGNSQGLYSMLTVPREDAPMLFEIIARLNPTHGYVPDASGRMTALAWLVLGSVVADVPADHASNHFFDPSTGEGLKNATALGAASRLKIGGGPTLQAGGIPALDWWKSADNPLGYNGFASQFRKAVASKTPGERDRHLAGSLISAGAMLHVLQDMGSPSRVRNDIGSHQQQIGDSRSDRGSRFERIAALAFGRLGIPRPTKAPALASLPAHISNPDGLGLANIVSENFFSKGTLPRSFKVTRNTGNSAFRSHLDKRLRRPSPSTATGTSGTRFDLVAARNSEGATWRSESGTCLAQYRIQDAKVRWSMDDDCALEQLEELLPTVAGYGVSFLETLYPSDIGFAVEESILRVNLGNDRYGAGTLRVFAERADGNRTEYFSKKLETGSASQQIPTPPKGSLRVTAFFDGADASGSPLLASASSPWPLK